MIAPFTPAAIAAALRQRSEALRLRSAEARRRAAGCRAAATQERCPSGYRADMDASDSLLREAQSLDQGAGYLEAQAAQVEIEADHA